MMLGPHIFGGLPVIFFMRAISSFASSCFCSSMPFMKSYGSTSVDTVFNTAMPQSPHLHVHWENIMRRLLQHRGLKLIFTANLVSMIGSGMNTAAVTWFILQKTKSEM